jgi:hypothetical protein
MAKLGIDVDGVIADFNTAYIARIHGVTGENRFGDDALGLADGTWPPVWDYPEAYGYTPKQMKAVWKSIGQDDQFWRNLQPLPDVWRKLSLRFHDLREAGHEIYFITARSGFKVKHQTEHWLEHHGMFPSVLIARDKGMATVLLGLDAYIDDRLSNCNETMQAVRFRGMLTRVYLKDAPYNQGPTGEVKEGEFGVEGEVRDPALIVVKDVEEMLRKEGL